MTLKKRLVSALTAVCMLVVLISGVHAESEKAFVFKYGEKEITVCGNVDSPKAKTISDSISNGESSDEGTTRGLYCTLFGHNLAHMAVYEITHKYYATEPRCREIRYDVTYCTRCDYTVWTKIGESRIYCCK
jgi:hypothetical protein